MDRSKFYVNMLRMSQRELRDFTLVLAEFSDLVVQDFGDVNSEGKLMPKDKQGDKTIREVMEVLGYK